MERTNLVFSIINTCILVIAGIAGYFLVTTQELEESKSNISLATSEIAINHAELGVLVSEKVLADIKAELAPIDEALKIAKTNGEIILNLSQTKINEINKEIIELELGLKKANMEIDKLSKRTNVTLDVSSLINDIQPSIIVTCAGSNPPLMVIDCKYENVGSHKVQLSTPQVSIYRLQSNKYIDNKNFKYKGLRSNTVVSGTKGNNKIYITDLNNLLSKDFVVKIRWAVSLHSSVKNAVDPLLDGVVDKSLIDGLTTMDQIFRLTY